MAGLERKFLLTAATLAGILSGNSIPPSDQSIPAITASKGDVKTPEITDSFENNFMSSDSLEDLIAESEKQGKEIFPFAIGDLDDVDMSMVDGQIIVSVKNPIAYISSTDGILYAGKYGQKITVPQHIDLSIQGGLFTVEEIDEEKGTNVVTQFNFHSADFTPGWKKGQSKEKIKKGQLVLTFSGSQASPDIPQDTLVVTVRGISNPLDYFAKKDGKTLYWNGKTLNKA